MIEVKDSRHDDTWRRENVVDEVFFLEPRSIIFATPRLSDRCAETPPGLSQVRSVDVFEC